MKTSVRNRHTIHESHNAIGDIDQMELVDRADALDEELYRQRIRDIEKGGDGVSKGEKNHHMQTRKIVGDELDDIRAHSENPDHIEQSVRTIIVEPSRFGAFMGRIPVLKNVYEAVGGQTKPIKVIETNKDIRRSQDMNERAREAHERNG